MPRIIKQVRDRYNAVPDADKNPAPTNKTSAGEARPAEPEDLYSLFPGASSTRAYYEWISKVLEMKKYRAADMELYDRMDGETPEIAAALDIYADNATQVGVTRADASRGDDDIVRVVTADEGLSEFLSNRFDDLKIDQRAWGLARDLVKMGEVFQENVVRQDLTVDRLKQLPANRMIRNEDEYGVLDRKKAFIQVDDAFTNAVAMFEPWEVTHFRLQRRNEDRYGTSQLYSIRRVFKQLQMIEDSMVLARMTRANTRYVFKIDTGNMPPNIASEHVKKFRDQHKKRRLMTENGLRQDANPLNTEEDIFLGIGKGSQAGVEQLYGDLNIGNLTDVFYFQDKMLGGIKIPKSYIGIERDINAKATLSQQDIQFARSVRRLQLAMRIGFNELAELMLLLEGDRAKLTEESRNARFSIALPAMQTVDEMREWEVTRIQSEVARIWTSELYLDPYTVYTELLGFTDQKAKQMFQGSQSEFAKMEQNKNEAKSFKSNADKKFSQKVREAIATPERSADQVIEDLRMLVDWELESKGLA